MVMVFIRVPYRRSTRLSSLEARIRASTPSVLHLPRLVSKGSQERPGWRFAFVGAPTEPGHTYPAQGAISDSWLWNTYLNGTN